MRLYLDTSGLLASLKRREEPEHEPAKRIVQSCPIHNEAVTSSLTLTELGVAYAKHTNAPPASLLKALEVLIGAYGLEVFSHDDFIDHLRELAFKNRELIRKFNIPAADIHHIAAALFLESRYLITTDKKHLLREEVRKGVSPPIQIASPTEACEKLEL